MQVNHIPFIPAFGFETSSHNSGNFLLEKNIKGSAFEKYLFQNISVDIKSCKEDLAELLKKKDRLKKEKLNKENTEKIKEITAKITEINTKGTLVFNKLASLKKIKVQKTENMKKLTPIIWKLHNGVKVLEYFPIIGSFFGLVRLANTLLSTKQQCPNKFAHITRAVLAIFCVGFVAAPVDIFYSLSSKKRVYA